MRSITGTTQQVGYGILIVVLTSTICFDGAFAGSSASVKCSDGKTYTASVTGGTCTTTTGQAECSNGAGDAAVISCGTNGGSCVNVGTNSKCSQTRVGKPSRETSVPTTRDTKTGRSLGTNTSISNANAKKHSDTRSSKLLAPQGGLLSNTPTTSGTATSPARSNTAIQRLNTTNMPALTKQ